jgi:hypothetical protein
MWLGVGFGVGVVALVATTMFLATLIGRIASGHMWVGALVTGILELAAAVMLIKRGMQALAEPAYTFPETRNSLSDTANWASTVRQ